jgi:hypothetical protein
VVEPSVVDVRVEGNVVWLDRIVREDSSEELPELVGTTISQQLLV